jgi:hypothetical protein
MNPKMMLKANGARPECTATISEAGRNDKRETGCKNLAPDFGLGMGI